MNWRCDENCQKNEHGNVVDFNYCVRTIATAHDEIRRRCAEARRLSPYRDGKKVDSSPIADAIDVDHDGKLTHEEWQKAGAPEASWDRFMSYDKIKKQGYILRADFLAESPPDGIDLNCDGRITLAEFLTFSKSMSAQAPQKP